MKLTPLTYMSLPTGDERNSNSREDNSDEAVEIIRIEPENFILPKELRHQSEWTDITVKKCINSQM